MGPWGQSGDIHGPGVCLTEFLLWWERGGWRVVHTDLWQLILGLM